MFQGAQKPCGVISFSKLGDPLDVCPPFAPRIITLTPPTFRFHCRSSIQRTRRQGRTMLTQPPARRTASQVAAPIPVACCAPARKHLLLQSYSILQLITSIYQSRCVPMGGVGSVDCCHSITFCRSAVQLLPAAQALQKCCATILKPVQPLGPHVVALAVHDTRSWVPIDRDFCCHCIKLCTIEAHVVCSQTRS